MSWEVREIVMAFLIRSVTVNLGVLRMQPPVVMFSVIRSEQELRNEPFLYIAVPLELSHISCTC